MWVSFNINGSIHITGYTLFLKRIAKALICVHSFICLSFGVSIIFTHVCVHVYINMYIYVYINIYIYVYLHIYICMYIHIYTYTYLHIRNTLVEV